jgi:hypothetical protein
LTRRRPIGQTFGLEQAALEQHVDHAPRRKHAGDITTVERPHRPGSSSDLIQFGSQTQQVRVGDARDDVEIVGVIEFAVVHQRGRTDDHQLDSAGDENCRRNEWQVHT